MEVRWDSVRRKLFTITVWRAGRFLEEDQIGQLRSSLPLTFNSIRNWYSLLEDEEKNLEFHDRTHSGNTGGS